MEMKYWVISRQFNEDDDQDKLLRFIAFPTDEEGLKNTIKIAEMWGEKAIITIECPMDKEE